MRRAGSESGFVEFDGKLIGFTLAPNLCAEHEWGIKDLQQDFAIDYDERVFGLLRRKVWKCPPLLYLTGKKNEPDVLMYDRCYRREEPTKVTDLKATEGYLTRWKDRDGKLQGPDVGGAWSERDFMICVYGDENKAKLKTIHEAFLKEDIALMLGGGGRDNPFKRNGLQILIFSAAPQEGLDYLENSDKDIHALKVASTATGVEDVLKKAGKRWFALTPRWSDLKSTKDGKVVTSHRVMYWLNPMDQHLHNFGWYTVEQLLQWAENKGPIPMTQEQRAARGR